MREEGGEIGDILNGCLGNIVMLAVQPRCQCLVLYRCVFSVNSIMERFLNPLAVVQSFSRYERLAVIESFS